MDLFLLLLYLAIAIGFSFLCSIAEAVLLSITPSFVAELRRQENSRSAQRIIRLKENVDRPLSAILSMNTIAHTVGAAGVGAQATKVYGDQYVGITSAILTLLILVFSEIIPKTIGALYWRRLASLVAWVVDWLIVIMMPLVWLSELLTKVIAGNHKPSVVTRAEIAAMAELGGEEGLLHRRETRILRNLLRMQSVTVEDVMTPRTVVIAFEQDRLLKDVSAEVLKLPVSRIPLFAQRRDTIVGFALKSDLLAALVESDTDRPLKDFLRPIELVLESESLANVFNLLLDKRSHIAIVVDEYDAMEGLVTLEDVVETLLGLEIVDEADKTVDMQELAREQAKARTERMGIQVQDE